MLSSFSFKHIHKLQPRSTPCIFLGYPSNHRRYKCLDMTTNKIIICRHVLFNESTFPYAKLHTLDTNTYTFLDNELSPYIINHIMIHDQANPKQGPLILPSNTTPSPNSAPHCFARHTPSNHAAYYSNYSLKPTPITSNPNCNFFNSKIR